MYPPFGALRSPSVFLILYFPHPRVFYEALEPPIITAVNHVPLPPNEAQNHHHKKGPRPGRKDNCVRPVGAPGDLSELCQVS